MSKTRPTFISLFSGCGGFDVGFLQAGFKCVGAFDINQIALDVLHQNTNSPVFKYDLSSGEIPADVLNKVDVVLAGSPCQGFSTIGKRKLEDPRNHLLLVGGRIAVKAKAKIFIAENVPGVISGKHRKYWDQLHVILKNEGYKTTDIKCNGTDLGVPQHRSRLFFVAWKADKDVTISLPVIPGGTVKDVFHELHGRPNHDIKLLPKDSIHYKIAKKIRQNQKLSNVRGGARAVHTWDIPEVFGETSEGEKAILETVLQMRRQNRVRDFGDADPVPSILLYKQFGKDRIHSLEAKGFLKVKGQCHDISHTFNGKYRRLSWDKPSYTVDTRFGNPNYFLHPSEHRGLTVREAARIQGFPDTFVFKGTINEQFRMVGNAVPPPMAHYLANFIYAEFF